MPQDLDPRLALLYEMTPRCGLAADIGTDHGYLICALVEQGRAGRGIAADLNPQPLEKARREAARRGVIDRISFCLTDGLQGIQPAGLEAVIVAGMGGETIIHILAGWSHAKSPGITYLLQPMTKAERLRRWLWENGFSIRRERCCTAAGRLYSAIETAYTGESADHPLWEHYLGRVDPAADEDSRQYALRKGGELMKIAAGLRATKAPEAAARAGELEQAAKMILGKISQQEEGQDEHQKAAE